MLVSISNVEEGESFNKTKIISYKWTKLEIYDRYYVNAQFKFAF